MEEKIKNQAVLESDLDSGHAAGECRENVLQDFVKVVSAGYSG